MARSASRGPLRRCRPRGRAVRRRRRTPARAPGLDRRADPLEPRERASHASSARSGSGAPGPAPGSARAPRRAPSRPGRRMPRPPRGLANACGAAGLGRRAPRPCRPARAGARAPSSARSGGSAHTRSPYEHMFVYIAADCKRLSGRRNRSRRRPERSGARAKRQVGTRSRNTLRCPVARSPPPSREPFLSVLVGLSAAQRRCSGGSSSSSSTAAQRHDCSRRREDQGDVADRGLGHRARPRRHRRRRGYFAVPSVAENGPLLLHIHDVGQARAFNASLPAGRTSSAP